MFRYQIDDDVELCLPEEHHKEEGWLKQAEWDYDHFNDLGLPAREWIKNRQN